MLEISNLLFPSVPYLNKFGVDISVLKRSVIPFQVWSVFQRGTLILSCSLLLTFKKKTSKFPLQVQFGGIVLSWGFAGFSVTYKKKNAISINVLLGVLRNAFLVRRFKI